MISPTACGALFSARTHPAALAEPRGTLVEPWWNPGGTLVEPWWNPGGTLVEPWWNPGGTLVEPWWNSRGTLVEPYLRAAPDHPGAWAGPRPLGPPFVGSPRKCVSPQFGVPHTHIEAGEADPDPPMAHLTSKKNRAVGNGIHFCDTTERASQTLSHIYLGESNLYPRGDKPRAVGSTPHTPPRPNTMRLHRHGVQPDVTNMTTPSEKSQEDLQNQWRRSSGR